MKRPFAISSLFILALVVSACASASPTPSGPTATPTALVPITAATDTPAPAASSSPSVAGTLVALGQDATLGSFLVDSQGKTLYLYTRDTPNVSNCGGGCVDYWPPLLTNGAPVAGAGVNASLLGSFSRADGTTQVTYNGWPLYYYIGDQAAGDTKGENVQNVWFVVTPDGNKE